MPAPDDQTTSTNGNGPLVRLKLDQIQTDANNRQSTLDATGQGQTAAVEGMPTLLLDEVFGRSLRFSDPKDAVVIELPVSPESEDGGFTLAIWVKPGQVNERATVVSLVGKPGWWGLRAGDYVEFCWRTGDTDEDWQRLVSPERLALNEWTHVAVIVGGDKVSLFINGTSAGDKEFKGKTWSAHTPLRLGHNEEFEADLFALQHTLVHGDEIQTVALGPNMNDSNALVLLIGSGGAYVDKKNGTLSAWDPNSGSRKTLLIKDAFGSLREWIWHDTSQGVQCIQFGTKGNFVVGFDSGLYSYWGERSLSFNPLIADGRHEGDFPLGVASDGKSVWVVATTGDVWGFEEGAKQEGKPWGIGPAAAIAYDHSSDYFLVAQGTNVRMIQFKRGRMSEMEEGNGHFVMQHDAAVVAIASSENPIKTDQNQLVGWVTVCEDGSIHLWGWLLDSDGQPYGLPEKLRDASGPIEAEENPGIGIGIAVVAFSPDGKTFVTAGTDGYAVLWEAATGKLIRKADGGGSYVEHGAPIKAVACSPDGRFIVTGGEDGTAKIWNVNQIRGEHPHFQGNLSNLRLYPQALKQDEIEAAILKDLPEIQVGTIFPLDFSLHNDQQQHVLYLVDEAQQLHLDITNVGRRNVMLPTGNGNGKANAENSVAALTESTLEIRFRPGTLKPESMIGLAPPDTDHAQNLGHIDDSSNWELTQTREPDGSDVIHLVRKSLASDAGNGAAAAATTLLPGETLYLTLGGLLANVSLGSHSTRMQLKYRLHYDDHSPLYGSRLHYLRVLNMSDSDVQKHVGNLLKDIETKAKRTYVDDTISTSVGEVRSSLDQRITGLSGTIDQKIATLGGRVATLEQSVHGDEVAQAEFDKEQYHLMQREYFKHGGPLVAGIVGTPAVLNDGSSSNILTLRIDNRDQGHPTPLCADPNLLPTFRVYLSDAAGRDWNLLNSGDLGFPQPTVSDGWHTTPYQGNGLVEITRPNTGPNESLTAVDLTFELKCSAETGSAFIVIQFDNIGETDEQGHYFEGWLRVPVERSPIVPIRDSTLARGNLNLINNAYLGFHHTDKQADFDPATPGSAVSIDANGALQIASRDAIGLYPGAKPTGAAVPVGTKGLVIRNDGNGAKATLGGDLSAEGKIDAVGAMSAASLTIKGDISVERNVGSVADLAMGWNSLVPRGAIIMWNGDPTTKVQKQPLGWAVCDGTQGTPDLRSKFIVGVGTGPGLHRYNMGDQGGLEQVQLTEAQMPSHSHSGTTDNDGKHVHTGQETSVADNDDNDCVTHNICVPGTDYGKGLNGSISECGSAHIHNLAIQPTGGEIAHENRPPYYALFFIMKL